MGTFSAFRSLRALRKLSKISCERGVFQPLSTKHSVKHPSSFGHKLFHTSPCSDRAYTLSQLKSRSVIQLSGNDTFSFLQGLVTNDVSQLEEKSPSTQYCMILNVQGRVLYDLFLYNISCKDKSTVLVDVDRAGKEDLLKLLKRYKLRKKVVMADVSDQYKIWCQFNSSISPDSLNQPMTFHDPRVPLYGCRFILSENSKENGDANVVSEEEYTAWRYRLGLPEGVVDLPPGNCLPLESNLSFMNGVNFQKGCYVGQELTARTFHTGVIRKRIVPLQLETPADIECDATITTKEKGRNAGKFRNAIGSFGLGLLRLAHLKDQLVVTAKDGQSVPLTPSIPDWWPQGVV